jgi:hypothetical protein
MHVWPILGIDEVTDNCGIESVSLKVFSDELASPSEVIHQLGRTVYAGLGHLGTVNLSI